MAHGTQHSLNMALFGGAGMTLGMAFMKALVDYLAPLMGADPMSFGVFGVFLLTMAGIGGVVLAANAIYKHVKGDPFFEKPAIGAGASGLAMGAGMHGMMILSMASMMEFGSMSQNMTPDLFNGVVLLGMFAASVGLYVAFQWAKEKITARFFPPIVTKAEKLSGKVARIYRIVKALRVAHTKGERQPEEKKVRIKDLLQNAVILRYGADLKENSKEDLKKLVVATVHVEKSKNTRFTKASNYVDTDREKGDLLLWQQRNNPFIKIRDESKSRDSDSVTVATLQSNIASKTELANLVIQLLAQEDLPALEEAAAKLKPKAS